MKKGGFAEKIQVNARFAIPIPDGLNPANTAPLMCGGSTVYSPLRNHVNNPDARVGIIGIGGLGHLALQFAHAMGFEVAALSSNSTKEPEAKKFGANHFINYQENNLMPYYGAFDFILSTVSASLEWDKILKLLRPQGKLCIVGVPEKAISVQAFSLIEGEKAIVGSAVASPHVIEEMLHFAARHNIQAQIEEYPMRNINEALDRLRANEVRYRAVLVP